MSGAGDKFVCAVLTPKERFVVCATLSDHAHSLDALADTYDRSGQHHAAANTRESAKETRALRERLDALPEDAPDALCAPAQAHDPRAFIS